MNEYRVSWRQCPHAVHEGKVHFVRAASSDDAKKIAHDYIERKYHITWFTIFSADVVTPPPAGEVLGE